MTKERGELGATRSQAARADGSPDRKEKQTDLNLSQDLKMCCYKCLFLDVSCVKFSGQRCPNDRRCCNKLSNWGQLGGVTPRCGNSVPIAQIKSEWIDVLFLCVLFLGFIAQQKQDIDL